MKVKFCDKKFFTRGIAYLEQKERKKSFLTTLFSFLYTLFNRRRKIRRQHHRFSVNLQQVALIIHKLIVILRPNFKDRI